MAVCFSDNARPRKSRNSSTTKSIAPANRVTEKQNRRDAEFSASLRFVLSVLPRIRHQDSQCTECIPTACCSSRTFHIEVDRALVWPREGPSPVLVSTFCDQLDGFV